MEEVAVQAGLHKVPVISPVPLASGISLGNVFFSYTSDDVLRERMLTYMRKKVTDQNIIVIATQGKLHRLNSLRVDTGNLALNKELQNNGLRVISDYAIERTYPVE